MKMTAFILLIVGLLVVFFQNSDPVRIHLLLWQIINIPMFVLMLVCIAVGWLLGHFFR